MDRGDNGGRGAADPHRVADRAGVLGVTSCVLLAVQQARVNLGCGMEDSREGHHNQQRRQEPVCPVDPHQRLVKQIDAF